MFLRHITFIDISVGRPLLCSLQTMKETVAFPKKIKPIFMNRKLRKKFLKTIFFELKGKDNIYFAGYGFSIGQNLAWGHSSWVHAIQAWFDEVDDYVYGVGLREKRPGESQYDYDRVQIGHYTQVLLTTKTKQNYESNSSFSHTHF